MFGLDAGVLSVAVLDSVEVLVLVSLLTWLLAVEELSDVLEAVVLLELAVVEVWLVVLLVVVEDWLLSWF